MHIKERVRHNGSHLALGGLLLIGAGAAAAWGAEAPAQHAIHTAQVEGTSREVVDELQMVQEAAWGAALLFELAGGAMVATGRLRSRSSQL